MSFIKSKVCSILALCLCVVNCSVFTSFTIKATSEEDEAMQWMVSQGYFSSVQDGDEEITAIEYVELLENIVSLDTSQGSIQAGLEAGWFDWDEIPPTQEKSELGIQKQLAVKILMKALLPEATGAYQNEAGKLSDLDALDGRYYDAVFAAYANDIVESNEQGKFLPTQNVTRKEVGCMIYRVKKLTNQIETSKEESKTTVQTNTTETNANDKIAHKEFGNRGGVSVNGWLQVDGTQLTNAYGHAVVLKGMSTHGLQWFSEYTSTQSIRNTASYGANVFRIAMYVDEGGYLTQPEEMKEKLIQAVDTAISLDMYVIIDFHTLTTQQPMTYVEEAKAFFAEMANRYKDEPAVIYEICNEFYGDITWSDIKPYAEEVIDTIRTYTEQSIILIGTSSWGQDIDQVGEEPLDEDNIMYTAHFYAGTHGDELREKIVDALENNLPIFISEWGVSAADGNGGVFIDSAQEWIDFMNTYNLSWVNWSLCDKNESSAALKEGTSAEVEWQEDNFTESGQFVFSKLT